MEKIEQHRMMVPRGDRSGAIVEPYLTDQWYVKIGPLAKPAIEAVMDGSISFVSENWSKTYFDWMHRIEDWCISRQLWWGHRIPAWYDPEGNTRESEDARGKITKSNYDPLDRLQKEIRPGAPGPEVADGVSVRARKLPAAITPRPG